MSEPRQVTVTNVCLPTKVATEQAVGKALHNVLANASPRLGLYTQLQRSSTLAETPLKMGSNLNGGYHAGQETTAQKAQQAPSCGPFPLSG